ncbi:DUF2318 domain-containing protein [Heliorestis acidaminivorans]|uniref:DUF2318 domain-containing protein n=1 Tax=Heliorestis acidaminivorans TaxID=553427 RepID=A0A6I0F162_9FIRM|nr:Fe-S-containing protein [Heliorestis acidaminivorans]KAB2953661.1 DUF2318 domain-containing protein [Heliorestis acidaminivorans]
MSREKKRQQFSADTQKATKNKTMLWSGLAVAVVILVAGFFLFSPSSDSPVSAHGGDYWISEKPSYAGIRVAMADVDYSTEDGGIVLSLQEVIDNKIVYFEHAQESRDLPLTAFVAPNGRIIAAVSVCEPCNGNRFSLSGTELVCNTCTTRWDLNTLRGKSGACMAYPPDELPYVVEGDKLIIDESAAKSWRVREYNG